MIKNQYCNKRLRLCVGLVLLVGFLTQYQRVLSDQTETASSPIVTQGPMKPSPSAAVAAPLSGSPNPIENVEAFAARDPVGFFEFALERYDRSVRDYTCTFTKQELVGNRMTNEQVMKAMFCENPFSVRLEWVKNSDKCDRVLYVADRWLKDGQQMAVIEPGAIARLFIPYVMRPIHGKDAQKSSRRTIDQFGLRNSLALVLKYCKMAQRQNVLDFTYRGAGTVADRQTLVFERRLPYTRDNNRWPDRVLVVHIDKELLLPTLCVAYADDAKQTLLGKYMMTNIKLNANLPDSVFTKAGMGL